MKRIDVRSTENWRRFDFWAVIICILLLLLMLLSWLAGARFGDEDCCKDKAVAEPAAPAVEPHKPDPIIEPEPVVEPKEDYSLNFFRAGDNIVLEGAITDEITRDFIIFDAEQRFDKSNIISNLKITDNVAEFDTINLADIFSHLSDVNDFRLAINPDKWSVFGTVNSEELYKSLQTHFSETEGALIDNQLRLIETEPVLNCEQQLSLNAVEFSLNSAEITDAGKQAIAQVMLCLSNNSYDIVGHTDITGDADANQALSLARATAVRDYLSSLGVDTRAYTVTGKGESEPRLEGESLEANNRNRRVEFKSL